MVQSLLLLALVVVALFQAAFLFDITKVLVRSEKRWDDWKREYFKEPKECLERISDQVHRIRHGLDKWSEEALAGSEYYSAKKTIDGGLLLRIANDLETIRQASLQIENLIKQKGQIK